MTSRRALPDSLREAQPPILAALRHATRDAHLRLEQRLPFGCRGLDSGRYRDLLAAYHGYYAPIEARLGPMASAIPELDWPARRKTPLLSNDLAALGVATTRQSLPMCTAIPPIPSPAATLGCLYVLEGATLGGRVILRRVRRELGEDAPIDFFSGYGPMTGRRWRAFLQVLSRIDAPGPVADAAVTAAGTFSSFETWLEERGILQ